MGIARGTRMSGMAGSWPITLRRCSKQARFVRHLVTPPAESGCLGRAPAVDSNGNAYYASGNGGWDGVSNFGDSVMKFSTTSGILSFTDYFQRPMIMPCSRAAIWIWVLQATC